MDDWEVDGGPTDRDWYSVSPETAARLIDEGIVTKVEDGDYIPSSKAR